MPGMESVGTVESAGPRAEHLLGQRIAGIPTLAHGGYASHAVVDAATAMELPPWLSDADGAAMHYPFHLGWFALHERARLQPGETLLVHAAAGGTGSGALQMGKALGAKVIATAGSDEKVEYCRQLGADVAVNYRTTDFVELAMEATYGHGVDVAFGAVGGLLLIVAIVFAALASSKLKRPAPHFPSLTSRLRAAIKANPVNPDQIEAVRDTAAAILIEPSAPVTSVCRSRRDGRRPAQEPPDGRAALIVIAILLGWAVARRHSNARKSSV